MPDLGKITGLKMSFDPRSDIHVFKYFSSFVSVSGGKVINITDPTLKFCPLASHLYKDLKNKSGDRETIKAAIKTAIESKIKNYGFFTADRKFSFEQVAIPYGASEMIGFALRQKTIDAAVMVCEGAGTVIVDDPDLAQGIGARMNSLLLTSPIPKVMKTLKTSGCRVLFENALIDQGRGIKEAIKAGYKRIAVTVCGHSAGGLGGWRLIEKENGVRIIILVVCTTGIDAGRIKAVGDYADLVWSCASQDLRRQIGPLAKCQLSRQIPVFVLTKAGMNFLAAYADEKKTIQALDKKKQHLISNMPGGQSVHLGGFRAFISQAKLPVGSRKEPCLFV